MVLGWLWAWGCRAEHHKGNGKSFPQYPLCSLQSLLYSGTDPSLSLRVPHLLSLPSQILSWSASCLTTV